MTYINIENVFLDYPIYSIDAKSFKKKLFGSIINNLDIDSKVTARVFNGISFKFNPGDRYIIQGENGSGKTTLLKLLSKVLFPTSGKIKISGKVTSLLDLTLGMNMDSSGYESIISRGILMGHSYKDIKLVIDEIIDFSGLGDYIYLPLHTYSSGMRLRLGFSISTAISADIFLLDEWLSVGDSNFQIKAENRLKKLIHDDNILIVASHDKNLSKNIGAKTLKIKNGVFDES